MIVAATHTRIGSGHSTPQPARPEGGKGQAGRNPSLVVPGCTRATTRRSSGTATTRRRTTKPRAIRQLTASADQKRSLLVIGNGAAAKGIIAALGELHAECVWLGSVDELDAALARQAIGIVWNSIGTERGFGRSIDRLRHSGLPIFVVVRERAPEGLIRGLYRMGVSGVFAWPREGLLLARYIAEMLSLRLVRGPAKNADTALARTIRAHLRHIPIPRKPIKIEVSDGRVSLRGGVDVLAHRDEIEHRVSMVEGVSGLDVSEIRVEPRSNSDADIRAACRRVIGSQLETRTVSAKVRNGIVRLEGSVPSRQYARRLRELVAHIQGVGEIENAITVSRGEARRDRGSQRRLQALLKSLFQEANFQLAFHGGVAVLDGRVPTLHVKRSMERALEQDSSVTSIVNKLAVRA